MKYDEEKFIIDALEKDEIKLFNPSKSEMKAIKATAKRTIKKKSTNIWDKEFEADVKNGLLDSLADEALSCFSIQASAKNSEI